MNPTQKIDAMGLFAIAAAPYALGALGEAAVWVGGILGIGWMASEAIDASKGAKQNTDIKQQEYEQAKRFCDKPPKPTDNICTTLSKKIDHAKKCIDLYENWDKRWLPGRHTEKIDGWKNRLANAKKEAKEKCSNFQWKLI